MAHTRRQRPADPVHRVGLGRGRRVGGDRRLDLVPALLQERRHLGRVRGGAADVGRPDPRDDEDLHGTATSGRRPPGLDPHAAGSTRSRRRRRSQTSIAPAAPVAPQREAKIRSSGMKTAISIACTRHAQLGPPDRDRERLRPAPDELKRRGHEHEPGRVGRVGAERRRRRSRSGTASRSTGWGRRRPSARRCPSRSGDASRAPGRGGRPRSLASAR